MNSLWVKNLFDSFEFDDEELAVIALESSLADIDELVINGYDGAPFSIGEFPFYATNQFENQAKVLQDHERKVSSKSFVSKADWDIVDSKLAQIAQISNVRSFRSHLFYTFVIA